MELDGVEGVSPCRQRAMWLALHLHAKPVSSGPFWVIVQPVGFTQIIIVYCCFTREAKRRKKHRVSAYLGRGVLTLLLGGLRPPLYDPINPLAH